MPVCRVNRPEKLQKQYIIIIKCFLVTAAKEFMWQPASKDASRVSKCFVTSSKWCHSHCLSQHHNCQSFLEMQNIKDVTQATHTLKYVLHWHFLIYHLLNSQKSIFINFILKQNVLLRWCSFTSRISSRTLAEEHINPSEQPYPHQTHTDELWF